MSVQKIKPGSRTERNGLPAERQDNKIKYRISEEMRKKGNVKCKFAVHVPELKMIIYTDCPEKSEELRVKYINRHFNSLKNNSSTEIKAI